MPTAHEMIQRNFNRASKTYDDSASIQNTVGEQLISLLSQYCAPNAILDIGCGTGVITQHLAQASQHKVLYALDISHNLLALAEPRLSSYTSHLYLQDYNQIDFKPQLFDLIFSNMAMQWSQDFLLTLTSISQNLTGDGICAFSIPLVGTFLELPAQQRLALRSNAWIQYLLQVMNFKVIMYHQETHSISFPSYLNALRYLKALGATYKFNRASTSLNSALLHANKPFILTYQIGYFIARKRCTSYLSPVQIQG